MVDGAEGRGGRTLKDVRGTVFHSQCRNLPEREEGTLLTLTLEGRKKVCNKGMQACSWDRSCPHLPCKEGGAVWARSETEVDNAHLHLQTGRLLQKPLGFQVGMKGPGTCHRIPGGSLAWSQSLRTDLIALLREHFPCWASWNSPWATPGLRFPHKVCFTFFPVQQLRLLPALSHRGGISDHSSDNSSCSSDYR